MQIKVRQVSACDQVVMECEIAGIDMDIFTILHSGNGFGSILKGNDYPELCKLLETKVIKDRLQRAYDDAIRKKVNNDL